MRAVYEIDEWHPAGSTTYATRNADDLKTEGRWEFVGRQAPEEIGGHYVDRSVAAYFPRGLQNPVVYVNC